MWMIVPIAGFVAGLLLGRWWALLAALPLGAWILLTNVLSLLLACAIGAGVALRRLSTRISS